MMCIEMKTIIPDTSAVIEGTISKIIAEEDLDYPEIIVPEAVVCELEHQANANRNEGINGLKELQKLQEAQDNGELHLKENVQPITTSNMQKAEKLTV